MARFMIWGILNQGEYGIPSLAEEVSLVVETHFPQRILLIELLFLS